MSEKANKTISSLADLTPDPANARKHNPRNVGMLVDSLHQVGAARSIVVDENGVVLAGNATIEAAAEAGIHRVKTVEADGSEIVAVVRRGLSQEQKTKLALYDNRVAELAEWNPDILAELVDTKELEGMFSDKELAGILTQTGSDPKDATVEPEKAAECQQKWQVVAGEIIQIGKHRLMCGDSGNASDVERLFAGERPQAVVADPPYGIDHDTNYRRFTGGLSQSRNFGQSIANDDKPFDPSPFLEFETVILWGANCYSDKLPLGAWLVWDKRQDGQEKLMSDGEVAWLNRGHGVYILNHTWNGFLRESERGKTMHPTQKPVAVMAWCMSRVPGRALVFDPFGGSGPVVAAAEETGRRCFAMEIEPEYCALICERMSIAFPHLKIERVDRAEAA